MNHEPNQLIFNLKLFFFKEKGYVYQEKFENTKGIIRRRQRIQWPKEKDKCRNNVLQNIAQKTKDRATRTSLKPVVYIGASEGKAVPAPHVVLVVLLCYTYELGVKSKYLHHLASI